MQELGRPPGRLRAMVVDDHEVVRGGLRALLEAAGDISVVAEAGTVRQAVEAADKQRPDVVVMDARPADGRGVEATREIRARRPETRVLMLTSFADDEALFASIMAGASGYVLKQLGGGELLRTVRAVAQGQTLLDSAVNQAVLQRMPCGRHLHQDERLARLSVREERILALIADGRTNRQIGQEPSLAEKTVKNHVSNILGKLDVERRPAGHLVRHTRYCGSR